jgi:hypothetical protein
MPVIELRGINGELSAALISRRGIRVTNDMVSPLLDTLVVPQSLIGKLTATGRLDVDVCRGAVISHYSFLAMLAFAHMVASSSAVTASDFSRLSGQSSLMTPAKNLA